MCAATIDTGGGTFREYAGTLGKKQEARFHVHINKKVTKTIREQKLIIDTNLLIKRIIADASSYLGKAKDKDIVIEVDSIKEKKGTVRYKIIRSGKEETREISFRKFEREKAVDEIVTRHIVDVTKPDPSSVRPVLERFAAKTQKRGLFAVLGRFFRSILEKFHFIDVIWEALTHSKAKKLQWNMNVLAEVCGTFPVKGLPMVKSLEYIDKMMKREKGEPSDPKIYERLHKALDLARHIESLKGRYSDSKSAKLIEQVQKAVSALDEDHPSMLLPVGYIKDGEPEEMLLEITKMPNGTYSTALISASKETRDLFDREMGVKVGSQAMRREIINIQLNDLLAAVPTFIGLQVSPLFAGHITGHDAFIQAFRFPQSIVSAGDLTEKFVGERDAGHLHEVISYVEEQFGSPDEAKRFDLAVRLRFFLDICQKNEKWLKDKNFWELARTTAHQLTGLIEKEKRVLGASELEQGIELTKIYGELKGLLTKLEESPPEITHINERKLNPLTGPLAGQTEEPTPLLYSIELPQNQDMHIDPPFAMLDEKKPLESMLQWGERCRNLMAVGDFERAANEAKILTRMIPNLDDPFWKNLNQMQAQSLLGAFGSMGESIARAAFGKNQTSLLDAAEVAALNCYGLRLADIIMPSSKEMLRTIMCTTNKVITDLNKSRNPVKDKIWINEMGAKLKIWVDPDFNSLGGLPPSLQPFINLNQFVLIAAGEREEIQNVDMRRTEPINFNLKKLPSGDVLAQLYTNKKVDPKWIRALNKDLTNPPSRHAPEYAKDVSKEIVNRYVTGTCPLGCTRDNCPNYNMISQDQHRFYPVYMVQNFVENYCKALTSQGVLTREEIIELLNSSQSNKPASELFQKHHHEMHGFEIADGFSAEDYGFQLINAMNTFFEHPQFFKIPELRWLFETKLMNNKAFWNFLTKESYSEHRPFIVGMLKRLNLEIQAAKGIGDTETAAYLLYVGDQLKDLISSSTIADKKELTDLLPVNDEAELFKWAKELLNRDDPRSKERQIIVFSLLLNNFHKNISSNKDGSILDIDSNFEIFMITMAKLESIEGLEDKLDPEIREKYQTLLPVANQKIKERIAKEKEKGDVVNKVLFHLNPIIAAKRLPWEPKGLPFFKALDKDGTEYEFNLMNGQLTSGANQQIKISEVLKREPLLKDLFGSTLDDLWKIKRTPSSKGEASFTSYTHKNFPGLRIVVKQDPGAKQKVIVERKILNQKKDFEWVTYIHFKTQDIYKEGKEIPKDTDLPPLIAAAIGGRTCWLDRSKTHVYVFDAEAKKPYAIMKLESVQGADKKPKTVILDFHIIAEDVHLLSANEKQLEAFSPIEDPHFIQIKGENNRAKNIDFVRLELASNGAPLSFDMVNGTITSPAFTGYELAPYGTRPGKRDPAIGVNSLPDSFDNFQLLKKDGKDLVLIPLRGFEQHFDIRGSSLSQTNMIMPEKFEKTFVFEYSVDPETNRLIAKSSDAYGYLAYVCHTHGDYGSAAFYLEKARTSEGYDTKYDQIFDWMNSWQNDSPSGIAMRLKFELFHEKVMEDRRVRTILNGDQMEAKQLEGERTKNLSRVANLYESYSNILAKQKLNVTGIDPHLMLSSEEERAAAYLIQELLDKHGKENADFEEPVFAKAEPIPMQQFLGIDRKTLFNMHEGALEIWAEKAGGKDLSIISVRDPRWLIQNFNEVFNKILTLDVKSEEFKRIEHQVRMVSEMPREGLLKIDVERMQKAQFYLMKLISGRKQNHPSMDKLKDKLEKYNGKLPSLSGALFSSTRHKQVEEARLLEMAYPEGGLHFLHAAKKRTNEILKSEEKADQPLKGFAKKALVFIQKYEDDEAKLHAQGKKPGMHFSEAFRLFCLNQIFGPSGSTSINFLDSLFKTIEKIPIKQDVQIMTPPSAPKPQRTYQERYGGLVAAHAEVIDQSKIELLEKEISETPIPPPKKLVQTAHDKITSVIGEERIGKVSKYFKVIEEKGKSADESIFDELSASPEKAVARLAEEHRKDLQAFKADFRQVSIKKDKAIKAKDYFTKEIKKLEIEREKLKKDILQYVERKGTSAGISAMRRLAGEAEKEPLDELIKFWWQGKLTQPWEVNPLNQKGMQKLSPEMLQELDEMMLHYLDMTTRSRHMAAVVQGADSYLATCGKADSAKGDAQLAKNFYDLVTTKRYYSFDPEDSPDYRTMLFMEYRLGNIHRQGQLNVMREMISDPNAVRQLEMGGGKTTRITPELAKEKANGTNLVIVMLPKPLSQTNRRQLNNTNRELFGQEMFDFDFSRMTNRDEVDKVYYALLSTIKTQGYVTTTKENLLSFKDSYKELIKKMKLAIDAKNQSKIDALTPELKSMARIANLFYTRGDVLADEIHAGLDVRQEVNFSLGEAIDIDPVKAQAGFDLMSMIISSDKGSPLYELSQALQTNTQAAIPPEKRLGLLLELCKVLYDKHKEELSQFSVDEFILYMNNQTKDPKVEHWVQKLEESDPVSHKMISSLKGFIDQGFATTLGRIGNVNYGRDPVSEIWTIPWVASNTPHIGSEFDDDIEKISFTLQDYLQNGVSYKHVYKIIARMQSNALAELRSKDPSIPFNINDSKSAKEFNEFIHTIDPEKKLGEFISLAMFDSPIMIKNLVAVINATPAGRLEFCRREVLAKMKQFSVQINSVSEDVPDMMHNFGGFTGTLRNSKSLHDKLNVERNLGVDGRSWHYLLTKNIPIKAFDFDPNKPVDSLLKGADVIGDFQAVIDTGAYLRGVSNKEFIQRTFELESEKGLDPIPGIYFDENGDIVKMMGPNEKPLLLENAPVTDPMKTKTFYDQQHTVGTDIFQGAKAMAVLTVGENTLLSDFFQAYWRFRKQDQDQKATLVMSKQVRELILNGEQRDITMIDILKFLLSNEAKKEAEDNFRAEKEKIRGFTKRAALLKFTELVVKGALNDETICDLSVSIADMFTKERAGEKAYAGYAKLKGKDKPTNIFDILKEIEEKKCKEIGEAFSGASEEAGKHFEESAKAIGARKNPPENWFANEVVNGLTESGGEVEMEAHAETEEELELMLQTLVDTETFVSKEKRFIPMVTGAGGHGDVNLITSPQIEACFAKPGQTDNDMRNIQTSLPIFDNEIFCSAVFERNLGVKNPNLQSVFYSNRKPVNQILIGKVGNNWAMVIPTIHEAHGGCKNYIKTANKDNPVAEVAISHSRPVMIYKNGDDRSDELPFQGDDLKHFYRLYVQAKLLNGEIDFNTDEEKEALRVWLKEKDAEKVRDFFERNILAAKPKTQVDKYPESTLNQIFEELIAA